MKNVMVKDLMTVHPTLISPNATLQEAAEKMKEVDCGMLPVGLKNFVEGVITDRDIMIRAIAEGVDPRAALVKDYMTGRVYACNESDLLEDAAEKMRAHKVGRLVVKDKNGKAVGVLSFGGILRQQADSDEVANVVKHATSARFF